jgi:hypothetical protein
MSSKAKKLDQIQSVYRTKNTHTTNKKKVVNEDEAPESIKKGTSARKKLGSPKVASTRVK